MGSSGGGSSSQQSRPGIPKFLLPLLQQTAGNWQNAENSLPNIGNLYNNVPLLNVPNLTGQQSGLINEIAGQGGANAGALNASEELAKGGFQQFLDVNGKPSAATQAGLKEFNDLQSPAIMQQAALMGRGTSGGALSALSQGQEQAMVPFLLADQQNALTAAGGLQNQGAQQFNQQTTNQQNALNAANMPYDVLAQQAQSKFNQQGQQWNLANQI